MAETAVIAGAAARHVSSSYRVKFRKKQFLDLIDATNPKIIYHVKRIHFFSYDGFVLYCMECKDTDFSQKVVEAIEFSNEPWTESK